MESKEALTCDFIHQFGILANGWEEHIWPGLLLCLLCRWQRCKHLTDLLFAESKPRARKLDEKWSS